MMIFSGVSAARICEGIVDVAFNEATQGRFGVKARPSELSNMGGAAIYASSTIRMG